MCHGRIHPCQMPALAPHPSCPVPPTRSPMRPAARPTPCPSSSAPRPAIGAAVGPGSMPISQWVKDAIRSTEAFIEGRGKDLYQLSLLDNADKHTIYPSPQGNKLPQVRLCPARWAENRNGRFITGTREFFPIQITGITGIGPGESIELHDNAECSPSIFFRQPDGAYCIAIPMLRQYGLSVCRTINTLERAIST